MLSFGCSSPAAERGQFGSDAVYNTRPALSCDSETSTSLESEHLNGAASDVGVTVSEGISSHSFTSSNTDPNDSKDSHEIKLKLIQSLLNVLNVDPTSSDSPSSSTSELISTRLSIPIDAQHPPKVHSIFKPYKVEAHDPPAQLLRHPPLHKTTTAAAAGATTTFPAPSISGLSGTTTSHHISQVLPLDDLFGRFESVRSFRAARLDGELEVVAAWHHFSRVPQDYPDLLLIPIAMWTSLNESLRLVTSRLNLMVRWY